MSQESPQLTDEQVQEMLLALRRKQGNWVAWAEACQTLQKSGWNPQKIFEETGFEPIQQNQIIGAAQVYASMLKVGVAAPVQAHFSHRASDVLYEFRVLSPQDRAAAAEFAFVRQMDRDDAHELGKAMKDFSRISQPPTEFTNHPGDVMAYFAWRAAKQNSDLQARSLLIAKGLKFAQTDTARQQIERLLTDFSTVKPMPMPRMPVYRLDSEEELPRVLPVVGQWPLTQAAFQKVPQVEPQEPFGLVCFANTEAWVSVPGWQVIRTAEDPVVILANSDQLPTRLEGDTTPVLIVVDRAKRGWNADSYFVMADEDDTLTIQWLAAEPATSLLGKVVLVMRPKKILDESYTQELYQWDE
jgi:hypothetical protein